MFIIIMLFRIVPGAGMQPYWISLTSRSPSFLSVVYPIGVCESIENVDAWELCKLQMFVVNKLLVGCMGVYSFVST